MLNCNAHALLALRKVSRNLLPFRSSLSRDILIIVASDGGAIEMRHLFKMMRMTPTAIRLNIQSLIDDGYLVCIRHDGRRKGPVTFRIDEMSRVEELPAPKANRTRFDLNEFAQQSFGAFFGEEPLSVIWRFSPAKADEAEKFIFHPSQTQSREPDGSLLVSFTAKGSVEMCWELFQWGKDVEIVAPERLKREYFRLSAEIAASAQRYESAQS